MKQALLLFIALLFFAPTFAQKGKKDIVYLKSGGIIKGTIVSHDATSVKINSADNQWVFAVSEIDSVSRFSKPKYTQQANNQASRYYFDTSVGVLAGNSANSQDAPFSFMASANYKIKSKLYAGVGIGCEFLDETYIPAYAQLQYQFRNSGIIPFATLQAGYQVPIESKSRRNFNYYYAYPMNIVIPNYQRDSKLKPEGGFLVSPSIGFKKFTSDNYGWYFSFGYRYHQLNYATKASEVDYHFEANYSRLMLRLGFIFN